MYHDFESIKFDTFITYIIIDEHPKNFFYVYWHRVCHQNDKDHFDSHVDIKWQFWGLVMQNLLHRHFWGFWDWKSHQLTTIVSTKVFNFNFGHCTKNKSTSVKWYNNFPLSDSVFTYPMLPIYTTFTHLHITNFNKNLFTQIDKQVLGPLQKITPNLGIKFEWQDV